MIHIWLEKIDEHALKAAEKETIRTSLWGSIELNGRLIRLETAS